jgi:hypothetical protein
LIDSIILHYFASGESDQLRLRSKKKRHRGNYDKKVLVLRISSPSRYKRVNGESCDSIKQ